MEGYVDERRDLSLFYFRAVRIYSSFGFYVCVFVVSFGFFFYDSYFRCGACLCFVLYVFARFVAGRFVYLSDCLFGLVRERSLELWALYGVAGGIVYFFFGRRF